MGGVTVIPLRRRYAAAYRSGTSNIPDKEELPVQFAVN